MACAPRTTCSWLASIPYIFFILFISFTLCYFRIAFVGYVFRSFVYEIAWRGAVHAYTRFSALLYEMSRWGWDIFGRFTALCVCREGDYQVDVLHWLQKAQYFYRLYVMWRLHNRNSFFSSRSILMYCVEQVLVETQDFCFSLHTQNTINRVCIVRKKLSQAVYNFVAIGKSSYVPTISCV